MKKLYEFVVSALVRAFLFVIPVYLSVLLLLNAMQSAGKMGGWAGVLGPRSRRYVDSAACPGYPPTPFESRS